MSNAQGIGAPKGGRVHWLLFNLPAYVRQNFVISYEYLYHNYFLFRKQEHYSRKTLLQSDFYTIVRTSKKCFRVTAHNVANGMSVYKSFRNSTAAGVFVAEQAQAWQAERDKEKQENEQTQTDKDK